MKRFGLIGLAGFVGARHVEAIKATGNELAAAMDRSDAVGILDRFFPDAHFFTELERLDRHLEKIKRNGAGIDYFSVCTPNHLHDAHVRFGLKHGASVICEKPLVLNPWNIEPLARVEQETGKKVFNILQLRLHPVIAALKQRFSVCQDKKTELDLSYITPRGNWYHNSWKGDEQKSGGIATNIGIHFFDMLLWIFGNVKQNIVHLHTKDRAAGFLELERARVRWFLSIDRADLPQAVRESGDYAYRCIRVDGENIEFSDGFAGLHTKSYQQILDGKGFSLMEAFPSIELAHMIRTQKPVGLKGDVHPMVRDDR